MSHHHQTKETILIPEFLTFSLGYVLKASLRELKTNYRVWLKLGLILFCFLTAHIFSFYHHSVSLFMTAYGPFHHAWEKIFTFSTIGHSFLWTLLNLAIWSFLIVVGSRLIMEGEKRITWDRILRRSFQKVFFLTIGLTFLFWGIVLNIAIGGFAIGVALRFLDLTPLFWSYQLLAFLLLALGGGIALLTLFYCLGRFNFYPQAIVAGHDQALCYSWKLTKGCVLRIYMGYIIPAVLCLFIWGSLMLTTHFLNLWFFLPLWGQYLFLTLQTLPEIFLMLFWVSYSAVLYKVLETMKGEGRLESRAS